MQRRTLVLIGCVIAVVPLMVGLGYLVLREDVQAKVQRCDQLLRAFADTGKFNGDALIAKNGKVILKKGYGVRNELLGEAHDGEGIFRIYSITKPFTSAMILRLVEQGNLSLDDPISKFFPDLPSAKKVSVNHLLTHTSGYYEFTRESDFVNTRSALLELLGERPMDFKPGEGWSYCNSGYCLLGHIIADVCDCSYEDAVTDQILKPLKLDDTGFKFNSLSESRKAVGYATFTDQEKIEATMPDEGGPFAAGAIYSTVDDLWRFQQALNNGELLKKSTLQKAWDGCSQNNGYGQGWQLASRWFMRDVISHSGGATGFRSILSQMPRSEYCVVLLNNHELADVEYTADLLYDVLDGYELSLPSEKMKLATEELESLVGFYQPADKHGVIRTYLVDGRLAVEFLGRAQGTLLAQGDDHFVQFESDVDVQFLRDDSGDCIGLIAKQDRMTIEAQKYEGAWGILPSTVETLEAALRATPKSTAEWHESAFRLAPLYLFNDQHDQYRELCQLILENHGDTDSPQIAERTVKVCLLSADAPFADEAGEMADRFFAIRMNAGSFDWGGQVAWSDYIAVAKGIADYRRDDFQSAISSLESATEFSRFDEHSGCARDLLLALALHRDGQAERANDRLAAAKEVIDRLPANYSEGAWNDRVVIDILQREAEKVVVKQSPASSDPSKLDAG